MSFSLVANSSFEKLTDISPELLKEKKISFLMLDLDNTIAPYGAAKPEESIMQWVRKIKEEGIELFIVSNSKRPTRAESFAGQMGIGYIKAAHKPSVSGIEKAMKQCGKTREESALCGDQIFTDVLGANRAGVSSFVVHPIKFTNPFLAIRYFFELPFRAAGKVK